MPLINLSARELEEYKRHIAANLLTYMQHDVRDALFPAEKKKLEQLRRLHKKLERV